jgi:DNA-binding Lrp family transcriptional regulator
VSSVENDLTGLENQIASHPTKDVTFEKIRRSAFVFITTELDSSQAAMEDLRKIDEVNEVYLSNGVYDLIAKVSADSIDHLRELVQKRIHNLGDVKSTLTLTLI